MPTLRRTLATACMLRVFTLWGCSVAHGADADWLTYNRNLAGDRFPLSRKSTVPMSPN